MGILQPPKIYLDTCHLIMIARLRKGQLGDAKNENAYRFLDECLRNRHFGLLFSPQISLEWVDGDATLESALEIAAVIDSAELQYEVEADHFVFLYEVLAELRKIDPNLKLPNFEVLYARILGSEAIRPLGVLANEVPEYFDDGELTNELSEIAKSIPFTSVASCVRHAFEFKRKRSEIYQCRVGGHKFAYLDDLEIFSERKNKQVDWRDDVGWMKRFLRIDRILTALNPTVDVDPLLSEVKISKCPGASLYLSAYEQRIRADIAPEDNDVEDWASIQIASYADLFLTEKRLCHFLRHADKSIASRVTNKATEAEVILKQWL